MHKIVAFFGEAGSGKSTAAAMLQDHLDPVRSKCYAFADTLKEYTKDVLGYSDDALFGPSENREKVYPDVTARVLSGQHVSDTLAWFRKYNLPASALLFVDVLSGYAAKNTLTPRVVLQHLGTDVGRAGDPQIWVNITLGKIENDLLNGHTDFAIITDGRFRNEAYFAAKAGAFLVKMQNGYTTARSTHQSEAEVRTIPFNWFDFFIENSAKDKNALSRAIDLLVDTKL